MTFEHISNNGDLEKVIKEASTAGREQEMKYFEEIITHEIEEWSGVIESATSPVERKKVIADLFVLNRYEEHIRASEDWIKDAAHLEDNEIMAKMIADKKAAIKEGHRLVNLARAKYNLPPKYTESE